MAEPLLNVTSNSFMKQMAIRRTCNYCGKIFTVKITQKYHFKTFVIKYATIINAMRLKKDLHLDSFQNVISKSFMI